ncbi:MAG: hypothetical protein FWH02_05810 [Oscillospiraceae bacterium]|nr:hypothetical protein [Oscillospiraceae bacterium]
MSILAELAAHRALYLHAMGGANRDVSVPQPFPVPVGSLPRDDFKAAPLFAAESAAASVTGGYPIVHETALAKPEVREVITDIRYPEPSVRENAPAYIPGGMSPERESRLAPQDMEEN